ncbi:hypothetical protein ACOSP7_016044 [Xanthoceras sorbifolium]
MQMATNSPPAKNAMNSPFSNKKLAFITKIQSNSFPRIPSHHHHHHHHHDNAYFASATQSPELMNLDSTPITYTSLKDLMAPLSRNSTRSPYSRSNLAFRSVHEIPISTNLVRKAAWAYSQPMPQRVSSTSLEKHFFSRVWDELKPPVDACVKFITNQVILKITRAFGRVVGAVRHA